MATTTVRTPNIDVAAYQQIATGPCAIQVRTGTIRICVAASLPAADTDDYLSLSQTAVPYNLPAVAADKVWARAEVEDNADVVCLTA